MLPGNFVLAKGGADSLIPMLMPAAAPPAPALTIEPTKNGSWLLSDGRAPEPFEYRTANEATLAARARARAERVSTVVLRDRYGRCHRIPIV